MATAEEQAAADKKAAADKAAADKVTADRAAADKAAVAKGGAVEGATSVAEAVKRVADAAVASIQKTDTLTDNDDIHPTGTAGGTFEVVGNNNLGSSGVVKLNGVQLHTREWSTSRIVGDVPAGSKSGEFVVHIDDKTNRKGYLKL